MIKHPKKLGFTLGLKIRIGEPAHITEKSESSKLSNVVYVALLDKHGRSFEKADVLKIGQTGRTLITRWRGIARIFHRDKLRNNEREDRRKWLKAANGREVSVWVKRAGEYKIPYAKGLSKSRFSTRWVEEHFLDQYYQPKLGMQLNRLPTEEPI
jgi:hypothetical protein